MRSGKTITLLIGIALTILLSTTAAQAEENGESIEEGYDACGFDFRDGEEGFGGVRICGIAYACGQADGVCPESYSSGPDEQDKTIRTQPYVRYGEGYNNPFDNSSFKSGDNYQNPNSSFNNVHTPFPDGDAACGSRGATCGEMLEVNATGGVEPTTDVDCSDSAETGEAGYSNLSKTYKASCENVPRVAGCERCPDPDCRTNITVAATDTSNNHVEDATAVFTNENNNHSFQVQTGSSGYIETDQAAFTGYFNVSCGADFYEGSQTETYVGPGDSKVLCSGMEAVGCREDYSCQARNEFRDYVCRSSCPDCGNDFIEQCEGRSNETYVNMGRYNDTHVEYQRCCTQGSPDYRYSPVANLTTGDISRFQVREIQREMDGEPVTMNVIVYDRD